MDQMFDNIYKRIRLIMNNQALMSLRVKFQSGVPVRGISVNGLTDDSGDSVVLDSSGLATGYLAAGSKTLSISGYADMAPKSKTYTIVKGETYTDEWTIETRNFIQYTSSGSVKFSSNCSSIDYSLAAGGGGGGNGRMDQYYGVGGNGGSGGFSTIVTDVVVMPDTPYSFAIGSGGSAGNTGGASSFMDSAVSGGYGGGQGNSNPGSGGNGSGGRGAYYMGNNVYSADSGNSGSGTFYSSFTETIGVGGGGGGGGNGGGGFSRSGGSPNGGYGSGSNASNGGSGSFPSGGGGGGFGDVSAFSSSKATSGGTGGSGGLAIRMHLVNE